MKEGMTYAGTGVSYDAMDPFKLMAQKAAAQTASNLERFNRDSMREFTPSRGESAYLMRTMDGFLAHVEEGLGTKNLVADAMYLLTGKSYYDQVAQCTVGMIVNDLITVGALPISVAMHIAVENSDWFKDENRTRDLVNGWKHACDLSRCVWGGGETPTLKGIIVPNTVLLAGSAIGIVNLAGRLLIGEKIRHGDAIIIFGSSGIHANGLTLARKIADKLPEGYLTKLSDGTTYGEALLKPTNIYVGLIEELFNYGVDIHYAVNVTGHGWRKLMRAPQPFTYVIEHLPEQLPIFDFIQKAGPVDDTEAYGNLNMGAGFAIYVPESHVYKVWEVLKNHEFFKYFSTIYAGRVESSEQKKVVIKPKGLTFGGETLAVR